MAAAAAEAEKLVVAPITRGVRDEVRKQGSKFHIRGRGGKPVRLGAKSNVKGFGAEAGPKVDVGKVSGDPAGFWRIVTDGSKPHIISGKRIATGRRRSQKAAVSRFLNVDKSFNDTMPLQLGAIGFRQYAHHPGHAGFGNPWGKAMNNSARIAREVFAEVTDKLLTKPWK